jgi:hypothetical protein
LLGPPNLDKLIQSLEAEAKKHQCTMFPHVNPNMVRIRTLGSRDMVSQQHGWNIELEFVGHPSDRAKLAQEIQKVSSQLNEVKLTQGTDKRLHFSFLG